MRVLGATLGEWGREKYGMKPVKRDALEYLPEYLGHMRDMIKEEQAAAMEKNAPCAFVTFRCAALLTTPSTSACSLVMCACIERKWTHTCATWLQTWPETVLKSIAVVVQQSLSRAGLIGR